MNKSFCKLFNFDFLIFYERHEIKRIKVLKNKSTLHESDFDRPNYFLSFASRWENETLKELSWIVYNEKLEILEQWNFTRDFDSALDHLDLCFIIFEPLVIGFNLKKHIIDHSNSKNYGWTYGFDIPALKKIYPNHLAIKYFEDNSVFDICYTSGYQSFNNLARGFLGREKASPENTLQNARDLFEIFKRKLELSNSEKIKCNAITLKGKACQNNITPSDRACYLHC